MFVGVVAFHCLVLEWSVTTPTNIVRVLLPTIRICEAYLGEAAIQR